MSRREIFVTSRRPFPRWMPAAALAVLAGAAWDAAAAEWMLMGREGGCVAIALAAERRPELRGIASPDELAARLRAEGEAFRRQDIAGRDGAVAAVQIDVPGRNLGLVFVPPAACR